MSGFASSAAAGPIPQLSRVPDALKVGVPVGLAGGAVFVLGSLVIGPAAPLGIAILACGLTLAIARPMTALYIAIMLIPLSVFSVPIGAGGLSPYELMFVITAFGWVVRRLAHREPIIVRSGLTAPILLLVASSVIGLLVVPDPTAIARIPIMWTVFFFLFQAVVAEGDSRTVRNIAIALCLVGAITGLLGITQTGAQVCGPKTCKALSEADPGDLAGQAARATTSAFAQPNRLGQFLALVIPFQLALAMAGPLRFRPVAALCLLPTAICLALTLSREAFLGIGASLLLLMILWPAFRKLALFAVLALFIGLLVGFNPLSSVVDVEVLGDRVVSIKRVSQDPRIVAYEETPQIISDHPVFGVGPDEYDQVSSRYGIVDSVTGLPLIHAHNLALNFAAERGLVGLGALFWWVIAVVLLLRRMWRSTRGFDHVLATAVLAGFVTLAVGSLADYPWQQNNILSLTLLLAGCAVVLERSGLRSEQASDDAAAPAPATSN